MVFSSSLLYMTIIRLLKWYLWNPNLNPFLIDLKQDFYLGSLFFSENIVLPLRYSVPFFLWIPFPLEENISIFIEIGMEHRYNIFDIFSEIATQIILCIIQEKFVSYWTVCAYTCYMQNPISLWETMKTVF